MTADPYARFDAVYLLGALEADERVAYEAHLPSCRRCRASLAEISAIPPLLAGLDESVLAEPPEVTADPVPYTHRPHGTDGATYDLGSWRLAPGRRVIFTSGTVLTERQIKSLQITQPNGRAILALRMPAADEIGPG